MSKPVLLSGGNGKVSELAGTANGQFLVNDENNDVVFSSATTPTAGQVPVWSGSAWAPGTISPGGGGGGGLTYLLNYSVAGASPTPSGTWKQLSLTPTTSAYNTGAGAVTAPNSGNYANLADFVTPLTEPGATTTPPGFWDLNVYLTSTGAADETLFRFSIHKWDGTTLSAAIVTSADVSITDPAAITLYTASVFVPSTVLSDTERIAIKVEVTRTTANAHAVTGYFEGVYYTHMHTTLGAPGSTGLVKVVNGIIQAPATLLVNADVSDTAAISVSKISGMSAYLTTAAAALTYQTITGMSSYLTTASAASTYLTQTNAASTYLTQTNAASTYQTKVGQPYDLPCEIPGIPDISKKVVNFKAVRAFVLETSGHQGGQLTAPSGNFVCTVRKNATTLGTITFGASSFSSNITGTLAERTFASTDVLSVETPSAALGIDTPFFTLFMTLA